MRRIASRTDNGMWRDSQTQSTSSANTCQRGLPRSPWGTHRNPSSRNRQRGPIRPNARTSDNSQSGKINRRRSVERDQAKVGFTGLLLALAACVAERNQEVVHETLQKTRTSDGIAWIKTKLGATVGLKRRIVYQAPTPSTRSLQTTKRPRVRLGLVRPPVGHPSVNRSNSRRLHPTQSRSRGYARSVRERRRAIRRSNSLQTSVSPR